MVLLYLWGIYDALNWQVTHLRTPPCINVESTAAFFRLCAILHDQTHGVSGGGHLMDITEFALYRACNLSFCAMFSVFLHMRQASKACTMQHVATAVRASVRAPAAFPFCHRPQAQPPRTGMGPSGCSPRYSLDHYAHPPFPPPSLAVQCH